MTPLRCLQLTAILAAISASAPVLAMQPLDEQTLSEVTGQAQGLRYTSEFDAKVGSITYYDDDGLFNGNGGSITLSPVRIYTQTNRPIQIDLEVKEVDGRKAVVFTNRDLPIELDIGSFEINGDSLGRFGMGNFQIGSGDSLVTYVFAGGHQGNGLTLDVDIPASMSFDTWIEDDRENARLTTTVDFSDPRNAAAGGLFMKDITFDLEGDGLRVGLPTTTGGNINFYNVRIGDDVLNSVALRNIVMMPGGYLMIKTARGLQEIGMELDLLVKKDSNLDFLYITGKVDGSYPSANVFELSANINLLSDFSVRGMRVNVDGDRGLVFDFDRNNSSSGMSAHLLVSNVTMMRSDKVATTTNPISLGTLDARLHLTNNSYLQVQGH